MTNGRFDAIVHIAHAHGLETAKKQKKKTRMERDMEQASHFPLFFSFFLLAFVVCVVCCASSCWTQQQSNAGGKQARKRRSGFVLFLGGLQMAAPNWSQHWFEIAEEA